MTLVQGGHNQNRLHPLVRALLSDKPLGNVRGWHGLKFKKPNEINELHKAALTFTTAM